MLRVVNCSPGPRSSCFQLQPSCSGAATHEGGLRELTVQQRESDFVKAHESPAAAQVLQHRHNARPKEVRMGPHDEARDQRLGGDCAQPGHVSDRLVLSQRDLRGGAEGCSTPAAPNCLCMSYAWLDMIQYAFKSANCERCLNRTGRGLPMLESHRQRASDA